MRQPRKRAALSAIAGIGWTAALLAVCAHAQTDDAAIPVVVAPSADSQTVSIAAQEADLRGVLRTLAQQAGLGFVIDPDVAGTITIDIVNRPLDRALEEVLAPRDFQFDIDGGVLRVYGHGLQTRLFTLDYMTSIRTGLTRLSASSGGGDQDQSSGGSSDTKSSFSVDSQSTSDPWAEIIRGLQLIVFGEVGGESRDRPERLVIHPGSGIVLARADVPTLNRVADFIEGISGSVHRQVQIDVQIVEVTLENGYEVGLDWSVIPNGAGSITSVFGRDKIAAAQTLSPDNRVFQIAGSSEDLNALLDALESQGRVKVISAPTVSTLNNQKAIVKVAREQSFFSQRIDYQILPDGTSEPVFSVEPQRITIGLILDVTPQISADAGVMMHVHPSLTELIGEDVFPPGASGAAVQANAPVLDIREVDTVVEVEPGNRLVIGGLIKERVSQQDRGVPFLGRIPLIGYLFKQTEYTKEQVELVIVLTPTLVIGEAADRAAAQRLERAESSAETIK